MICALPEPNYANGANCGKMIRITRVSTGKSLEVKVADLCPTCENETSVDLSTGAYAALDGTEDEGVVSTGGASAIEFVRAESGKLMRVSYSLTSPGIGCRSIVPKSYSVRLFSCESFLARK